MGAEGQNVQSQRAALYIKLHVSLCFMGNMEPANM